MVAAVCLRNVHIVYIITCVFNELTLTIHPGDIFGFLGPNGAGKSTLIKAMAGLLPITEGHVFHDGVNITGLRPSALANHAIAYVPQTDNTFRSLTIRQNLDLAMRRAKVDTAETLERLYAQFPALADKSRDKAGSLSGGQRQRLAIARALLKNPPILILDEATSAVDNETEAAIQRSLEKITQDRTAIAIAHRLPTIRYAHCIYVMENGVLVESGTHESLLAKGALYAGLWSVQTGDRIP